MSNRVRTGRSRRRLDRVAAMKAVRLLGCRCNVEVRHVSEGSFRCFHDEGCPVIGAPPTVWVGHDRGEHTTTGGSR